jgi:FMN phosphatase YigB (HAD superfamily)
MLENQQQIKVIGFDLDNTLYPHTPEIQRRIKEKIYKKTASLIGIQREDAREMFERLYNSEGNSYSSSGSRTIEEIGKRYGKRVSKEKGSEIVNGAVAEASILDLIEPNPPLKEMLRKLAGKMDLDLITNSSHYLTFAKLERIGIDYKVFSHMLIGGEHGSKSDGGVYRYWLSLRNLKPEQYMYVGDNLKQDVEPPKKLGIKTCMIGDSPKADFWIVDILGLDKILTQQ